MVGFSSQWNVLRNFWAYVVICSGRFPYGATKFTPDFLDNETRARGICGRCSAPGPSVLPGEGRIWSSAVWALVLCRWSYSHFIGISSFPTQFVALMAAVQSCPIASFRRGHRTRCALPTGSDR